MNWMKLLNMKNTPVFAGSIFRFPAKYPYEEFVDYMLVSDSSKAKAELKFVVTTGNKSGSTNVLCSPPMEAYVAGALAISSEWLKENWVEWVYNDCKVEDVYISEGYLPATALPGLS